MMYLDSNLELSRVTIGFVSICGCGKQLVPNLYQSYWYRIDLKLRYSEDRGHF